MNINVTRTVLEILVNVGGERDAVPDTPGLHLVGKPSKPAIAATTAYIHAKYGAINGAAPSLRVMRDALRRLRDADIVRDTRIAGVNGLVYWAIDNAEALAFTRLGILPKVDTPTDDAFRAKASAENLALAPSGKVRASKSTKQNPKSRETLTQVVANLYLILNLAGSYVGSHAGHQFHMDSGERVPQVTLKFLHDNYLAYTGTTPPTLYGLARALRSMSVAGVVVQRVKNQKIYYYLYNSSSKEHRVALAQLGLTLPVSKQEMKEFMIHVQAITKDNEVADAIVRLINQS